MGHPCKTESHLEKWITLGKMSHTLKIFFSHLENYVTFRKISRTWKKWVTLGKMAHPWKNGSHLKKCAILEKMDHSW